MLQELREQWDLDRSPVAAPSRLGSQGKRGWETCALLCPSHKPGGQTSFCRDSTLSSRVCLGFVRGRTILRKTGAQDKAGRQVGFYLVLMSCVLVTGALSVQRR